MTEPRTRLLERATHLKEAFDRSFAAPVAGDAEQTDDLLRIRVGGTPYGLKLAEITGLFCDKSITRLPGSPAALLGIAGFRGEIVPVYCLAALVGSAQGMTPRWLVVAAAARLALAFETFEGHVRVSASELVPCDVRESTQEDVQALVRARDGLTPVLSLPSMVRSITDASYQPLSQRTFLHVQ